jgi:GTPase SAR1 family protein
MSFESLRFWLSEIEMYATDKAQIILVGNKTDLLSARQVCAGTPTERMRSTFGTCSHRAHRKVSAEAATSFAKDHNMLCIETSAKVGLAARLHAGICKCVAFCRLRSM